MNRSIFSFLFFVILFFSMFVGYGMNNLTGFFYVENESSTSTNIFHNVQNEDSILISLNNMIEKEPKNLALRLHVIGGDIEDEKYGDFADKLVELRSIMLSNPTGWYIEDYTIDEGEIDNVLSEVTANWVEDLSKDRGVEASKTMVEELMKRDLPARILDESEMQLAMNYSAHKLYPEAIEIFKKKLANPAPYHKSAILFNIALYYYRMGNRGEALKYAKMAEAEGDNEQAPLLIADLERPVQHAGYYDFVFQLLPRLLPKMGVSEITTNLYKDPQNILKYFEEDYNIVVDKDLSGIKAHIITNPRGDAIVWTMPEPEKLTEPKYVAFVPDGDFYRFFTLEMTMDFEGKFKGIPYLLCGSNYSRGDEMPSHFNTGDCIDGSTCTPEKFVEYIENFLSR